MRCCKSGELKGPKLTPPWLSGRCRAWAGGVSAGVPLGRSVPERSGKPKDRLPQIRKECPLWAMLPCSRGNMEPRNGATSKGASNKTSSRRNGSASGPLEVGRHIKQGATKATKQPGIWAKVVDFILVSCQMSTTLVCNGKYPKDSHGQRAVLCIAHQIHA